MSRAELATRSRTRDPGRESAFYVPAVLDVLGGLVERYQRFWLWLGRLESSVLAEALAGVAIRMPIYVCGLARSGSTLLHEIIAAHPRVASHRMKDYPLVFTPYWWRRAASGIPERPPRERPHRDKVMVTAESADALEEMLWMAFFPPRPGIAAELLGADRRHPEFESFYRTHLGKLLLAERAARYVAKANCHVARLGYLVRLFPDARFVIPVRAPESHVVSLMRQHRWFSRGHRDSPRARALMRRSGHFEFGLDRRPVHLGDDARFHEVQAAWAAGEEVRGLALYWDMVYGHLARLLDVDAEVRRAAVIVRYESLCAKPAETLRAALAHCRLPDHERVIERYASRIRHPNDGSSDLEPTDRDVIRRLTAATARVWGY